MELLRCATPIALSFLSPEVSYFSFYLGGPRKNYQVPGRCFVEDRSWEKVRRTVVTHTHNTDGRYVGRRLSLSEDYSSRHRDTRRKITPSITPGAEAPCRPVRIRTLSSPPKAWRALSLPTCKEEILQPLVQSGSKLPLHLGPYDNSRGFMLASSDWD